MYFITNHSIAKHYYYKTYLHFKPARHRSELSGGWEGKKQQKLYLLFLFVKTIIFLHRFWNYFFNRDCKFNNVL